MFSQTRLFSQEEEISQLSIPLISDKTTNQNGEANTQGEVIEVAHCSTQLDALVNPQDDHQSHSTRADEICQQNRQLRGYLEKTLKQIEKRRIKLSNKNREIDEEIKLYADKYKSECQQSVDLQMSLEEVSENYQNELNGRENHKEKLDHIQIVIDYFVHQNSEFTKVTNDFEKDKEELKMELETLYNDLKAKVDEKKKLKLSYYADIKEKTQKAQETAECIKKTRETDVNQISALFVERSMNLNDLNSLQEKISMLLNKRKETNESYIDLVQQKKKLKENLVRLHQQLDELNTTTVFAIQKPKLQIINEQNNNSNLQVKCEENDKFINLTSTKEKELINLYNQMNGAIEETVKKQEDKQKKVSEYIDKKSIICNEIKELENKINEHENCEKMNELLKSEVKKLEESNAAKEIILQGKQNSVNKIVQEKEQLEKVYEDVEFGIEKLNTEIETLMTQEKNLATNLQEEKLKNQTERDAKLLNNTSLEQLNLECASKVKKLTYDLEEAQNANNNRKTDKMKISTLIEEYYQRKVEADEQLKITESELEEKSKIFENSIDLKNDTQDKIEKLIIDARPYQEELMKLLSRKEALNQDIQQEKENHSKEVGILKRNFNSKTNEICKEMEKYSAIMEGIIKDKVEATEVMKQNISKNDAVRMSHETDLQNLFYKITTYKHEEQVKRVRVAKLEKKLAAIKKAITMTRQDVNDAIYANPKIQVKGKNATETFSSSKRTVENRHQEPPQKKVAMVSNPCDNKNMNQTKTKQWDPPYTPQDEYEFSDI